MVRRARFAWGATALAALALLLPSRPARAAGRGPVWAIETDSASCAPLVPALAGEAQLACEAAGGACRVAVAGERASRRAVLGCTSDSALPWTLVASSSDGSEDKELWQLSLGGEREERFRKGALWIARTAPLESPPEPPTPARPAPESPAPEPVPTPPPVEDDGDEERPRPEEGGLSVDAFGALGITGRDEEGVRVMAFLRSRSVSRLGFALAVSRSSENVEGPLGITTATGESGRTGVVYAAGAPWTDGVAGFLLEGGVAAGARSGTTVNYCGACTAEPVLSSSQTYASPYVGASLVLQVPTRQRLRVWTAAGAIWQPSYYGDNLIFASLGAGIAWQAW